MHSYVVEYLNENQIAVVSIESFSTKTLNEFKNVIEEVKEKGITNLAIDVRVFFSCFSVNLPISLSLISTYYTNTMIYKNKDVFT